jgi:hypothetical protein
MPLKEDLEGGTVLSGDGFKERLVGSGIQRPSIRPANVAAGGVAGRGKFQRCKQLGAAYNL